MYEYVQENDFSFAADKLELILNIPKSLLFEKIINKVNKNKVSLKTKDHTICNIVTGAVYETLVDSCSFPENNLEAR